jgi:hypothetical protein
MLQQLFERVRQTVFAVCVDDWWPTARNRR